MATITARHLGATGRRSGITPGDAARLAELMDAVHNLPRLVRRWETVDQDLIREMLAEFDAKWSELTSFELLPIYERALLGVEERGYRPARADHRRGSCVRLSPSMQRRPLQAQDIEPLFAVHREAYRQHTEQIWGPWDDARQRESFAKECAQAHCDVFADGNELIGYVQFVEEPTQVRLWNIVLRPDYRGQRIGSGVVRDLQQRAAARGVVMTLRVFPTNDRAYRFYLRLGFQEVSRTDQAVELAWSADS